MKVVTPSECETNLRQTRLGEYFELDSEAFICAGGDKDKDMCSVSC